MKRFQPHTSRSFGYILFLIYAGALISILLANIGCIIKLSLMLIVIFQWIYQIRQADVAELICDQQGWSYRLKNETLIPIEICQHSIFLRYLIILQIKTQTKRQRKTIIWLPDHFSKEDWQLLRAQLHLSRM